MLHTRGSSAWRWRRINRPGTCLRSDHSPLRHNRLAWHGLRRRSRCSLRACGCHGWREWSFWRRRRGGWRRNNCCRRMYRRRDHNCGRCGRFFNWRRRNHDRRRRLDHGRCNHNTSFRCRCSRFGDDYGWLLARRRHCWRRRSSRLSGYGRRSDWRCGWLVLLLLFLLEQPHYVARLGDLRKVNLRLDLRGGRPLPRRRAGFGGKVLSHPYRFILFNGA